MDIQKVVEFLGSYKRRDLDYDCVTEPNSQNGRYVNGVKIKASLPIASPGSFEHALANRIAQKYGIAFEEQNVNRSTDGAPLYKLFFTTICHGEDEAKTKIDTVIQAKKELDSRFEKLAEFVMKTE